MSFKEFAVAESAAAEKSAAKPSKSAQVIGPKEKAPNLADKASTVETAPAKP